MGGWGAETKFGLWPPCFSTRRYSSTALQLYSRSHSYKCSYTRFISLLLVLQLQGGATDACLPQRLLHWLLTGVCQVGGGWGGLRWGTGCKSEGLKGRWVQGMKVEVDHLPLVATAVLALTYIPTSGVDEGPDAGWWVEVG